MIKVSLEKGYKFLFETNDMKPAKEATLEDAGNGRYNLVSGMYKQTLKKSEYDEIIADQSGVDQSIVDASPADDTKDVDPRIAELKSLSQKVLVEMAREINPDVKGNSKKDDLIEIIISAPQDEE